MEEQKANIILNGEIKSLLLGDAYLLLREVEKRTRTVEDTLLYFKPSTPKSFDVFEAIDALGLDTIERRKSNVLSLNAIVVPNLSDERLNLIKTQKVFALFRLSIIEAFEAVQDRAINLNLYTQILFDARYRGEVG